MLFKEIVDGRTHARTDGRRTPDIEGSQKLTEHFVLRWAKKGYLFITVYCTFMPNNLLIVIVNEDIGCIGFEHLQIVYLMINNYLSFKMSFHVKLWMKSPLWRTWDDIYVWIMFPPELAIVRRNWLNDNVDKTVIFKKFVNKNMKEKDVIL